MPATIDITLTLAGDPIAIRLYAAGAMYWPDEATLFITDPHFGKADAFHHAGMAIPATVLDHDLTRLARLLVQSRATRLVILGDFFHTRHSQSDNVLLALEAWRQQHPELEIILIRGNHDLHAGKPPAYLDIHVADAPFTLGPFQCHHLPQPEPSAAGYSLAGHLHPYVLLRDRDGTSLRLPSYIIGPNQAILPAFGGFTGGHTYRPLREDRVFVIAESEIIEVATTRQSLKPTRRQ